MSRHGPSTTALTWLTLLAAFSVLGTARVASAGTCTLGSSGSWTNEGIWNCGNGLGERDVASGDAVIVTGAYNLTINASPTVASFRVATGYSGSLTASAGPRDLTVTGDLTMEAGSFPSANVDVVSVGGTLILNGGTFNKSTTLTLGAGVSMGGGTLAGVTSLSVAAFSYTSGTLSGVTSLSVSGTATIGGNFTPPTTFSPTNLTISGGTFSGGSYGTLEVPGNFSTSGTSTFTAPALLVVGGVVDLDNSAGAFTGGSGTLILNSATTPASSHDFLASGVSLNDVVINNGLIAYWRLDETADGTVTDHSGWGHHLTHVNTPSFPSASAAPTKFRNVYGLPLVKSEGAAYGDYAEIATLPATLQPTLWTLSAWVNSGVTDTNGSEVITINNDILMRIETSGYIRISHHYGDASLTEQCITATGTLLESAGWHHVAATFSGTEMNVYLDGVAVDPGCTGMSAQTYRSSVGVRLGAHPSNANYDFGGIMDEVRVYDRVLSAAEVAVLATGTQPGLATPVHTFGTTVSVGGDLIIASGTLAGSSAITVGDSFYNFGGFFSGTGLVTLNGSNGGQIANGQPFGALTINAASKTWSLQDRLWVDGVLTISAGTLTTNNYVVHAGTLSKVDGAGAVFTPGTGTLVLDGSTPRILTVDSALNNLRIEDPTETGLVAYWKFDEAFGDVARDRSGLGNNGALLGGVTRRTASLPATSGTASIRFDNAGALDFGGTGTDGRVVVNVASAYNPVTVSALIYVPTSPAGQGSPRILEMSHFRFYVTTTNKLGAYSDHTSGTDGDWQTNATTGLFSRNAWHHVAVTYDGSTLSNDPIFYLDGSVVPGALSLDTSPTIAGYRTASDGYIGNSASLADDFSGRIDDLRVYNAVLTPAEIALLATGYYPGRGGTTTVTLQSNTTVSGTTTVDSGTSQTVYRAHEDTGGSIEGFPILAFDWGDFDYHATYVAYNNAVTSDTGKLFKRTTDGANTASWTLPTGVNFVGSPKWSHNGVANSGVFFIYVAGTNGTIYKITDSTFLTAATYNDGASASVTSPLAVDGTNVYWTGKSGGNVSSLFKLQQSNFTTVSAVGATVSDGAVATLAGTDIYFANATSLYRAVVSPLGTPAVPSPVWSPSNVAVYGRVSVISGAIYFVDHKGWAWSATAAVGLAKRWSYNDSTNHAGCAAGGLCAAKHVFVNFGQSRLYFGDQDGHLYNLKTSDGTILNANYPIRLGATSAPYDAIETAPLYHAGIIAVGSTTGKVFFVDQTNASNVPIVLQTFNFCTTSPCDAGGSAISSISWDSNGGTGQYVIGTKDGKLFYVTTITDSTSPL